MIKKDLKQMKDNSYKKCYYCNKRFIPKTKTQKFCCPECNRREKDKRKYPYKQHNKQLRYIKIEDNKKRGIIGCERCGYKEDLDILELHHKINRFNKHIKHFSIKMYRNQLKNLEILCPNCHKKETNKLNKKIHNGKTIKDLCPFCHSVNYITKTQKRKRCFLCGKSYYIGEGQYMIKDKLMKKYRRELNKVRSLNLKRDSKRFEEPENQFINI